MGVDDNAPVYGAQWDKTTSPLLTRTGAAVGLNAAVGVGMTPAANHFDKEPPWMFEEVTVGVHTFVRIPAVWVRVTDTPTSRTWEVSARPFPGAFLPAAFWDFTNNRALPYVDVGKYVGSLSGDNKLQSVAGQYPLINRNIVQIRDLAQANGAGYQQFDIHVWFVLWVLFTIEFATLNSQGIMQGFTTGQYNAAHVAVLSEASANRIVIANPQADLFRVGQAISVGTSLGGNQVFYGRTITAIEVYDASNKSLVFDGAPVAISAGNVVYNTGWKSGFSAGVAASSGSLTSNSDGKWPCTYRGIENPWGSTWCFADGANFNNNQAWICLDADQYVSNLFAPPYRQLSYVNHNANGYWTMLGFDPAYPFAAFPTAVGAGWDYYYQDTGQRIALVGGDWYYGARAGLSYWGLVFGSSSAGLFFAGRLLKKALS